MALTRSTLSRFANTDPIIHNGKEAYGLWVRPNVINPNVLNENDIQTIQITQHYAGRPDLIAVNEYGTPYLEWVVIMFNRPLNPLGWPQVGLLIKIPKRTIIRSLL
jgi:hypothetical protein